MSFSDNERRKWRVRKFVDEISEDDPIEDTEKKFRVDISSTPLFTLFHHNFKFPAISMLKYLSHHDCELELKIIDKHYDFVRAYQ